MDFSNFEIEPLRGRSRNELYTGVYALGRDLLPEIADGLEISQLSANPSTEEIQRMIGEMAPHKTLQDNIGFVKERLGYEDDPRRATDYVADQIERSGALKPLRRAFREEKELPEEVDAIFMTGGIANWILRRRNLVEQLDASLCEDVYVAVGNRVMSPTEHALVRTFERQYGHQPTEAEFMSKYVNFALGMGSHNVATTTADTRVGDEVIDTLLDRVPYILDGTVLAVGNAPNTIQSAGQFREAAQRVNPDFDEGENPQLFMIGDTIQVARHEEGTATHQNPFSALGQIVRNALYIQRAVESFESRQ